MAIEQHDMLTMESTGATFPARGGSTLARFDRPQGSGTTLAVVADPHLTPTEQGSLKVYHRTKQRFQMAIADAHRLDVDGVLLAGDLTKDGEMAEYALAEQILATAPEPTVAVPGNHDVVQDGYIDSGTQFSRQSGHEGYPCTADLDGTSVIGLDTTQPARENCGGGLGEETLGAIEDRQPQSTPQIALMHHSLVPIPEPFAEMLSEREFRIQEPERTADRLVEAGIDVVITGHLHWPYAREYRGLTVVGAPGCSSFPPAYLLVHLDSRGTTVTMVPLAGQAGLTEAYEHALEHTRGPKIRDAVENGYFEGLPLVDTQDTYGAKTPPPLAAHADETP
jgi:predicted phosphodiesterase